MSDDLVRRLRSFAALPSLPFGGASLLYDAADALAQAERECEEAAQQIQLLISERDEARALLRECRPWIKGDEKLPRYARWELLARLDAALKEEQS